MNFLELAPIGKGRCGMDEIFDCREIGKVLGKERSEFNKKIVWVLGGSRAQF